MLTIFSALSAMVPEPNSKAVDAATIQQMPRHRAPIPLFPIAARKPKVLQAQVNRNSLPGVPIPKQLIQPQGWSRSLEYFKTNEKKIGSNFLACTSELAPLPTV